MTVADRLREEGRMEGRIEGRIEALPTILGRRFGPVPPDIMARIRAADEPTVNRWTNRVLAASSLDEALT